MKSNTADMVFEGLLIIADDNLILGHRTSEWCGHAPTLEEDLALPNIALDLIGHAQTLYCLACEIDWDEFWRVVRGDGPMNNERISAKQKAWNEGSWVRAAAHAHAIKKQAALQAAE